MEAIKEKLRNFGYEATSIVNVISRLKKPLTMFFVDITKVTFNENTFCFSVFILYKSHVKSLVGRELSYSVFGINLL